MKKTIENHTLHSVFLPVLFVCLNMASPAHSADLFFTVKTGEHPMPPIPFRVELPEVNLNRDSLSLTVYRLDGSRAIPWQSQRDKGTQNALWVLPDKAFPARSEVACKIAVRRSPQSTTPVNAVVMDEDEIILKSGKTPVLAYHYGYQDAPEGVNPLYGKSGFIHPLYSPSGKILTRIQPADHYHHYGIWNPWTKIRTGEQQLDLWNLVAGDGTVRFSGLQSTLSGPLFHGFRLSQEHVNFQAKGPDQVIIRETWSLTSFPVKIEDSPCWLIDLDVCLNNALETGIELEQYRYGGGIGFRATGEWTRENSRVLTSEGKTRKDADASRARWCRVEGSFEDGNRAGIIFFSHPTNRAYPEPMRVWPENMLKGRGDLFFQFCPIRHKAWFLEPGQDYVQKYRMLVFDHAISAETAESIWYYFAHPPEISREK